jgi:hypothetical protein
LEVVPVSWFVVWEEAPLLVEVQRHPPQDPLMDLPDLVVVQYHHLPAPAAVQYLQMLGQVEVLCHRGQEGVQLDQILLFSKTLFNLIPYKKCSGASWVLFRESL